VKLTAKPMQSFRQGDVIRVPFPYTDRSTRQHRPALVISKGALGDGDSLLWVAMIASAENRSWPEDVPLGDLYEQSGLPAPSVIRTSKLATIEARHAERLGHVKPSLMDEVTNVLRRHLGL